MPIPTKPENRPYEIRRIFLQSEANEIRQLQRNAPEFDHYPRHRDWLDRAIDEIVAGRRIAFGAFIIGFDRNSTIKVTLVGSIILKPNPITNTIELKNLFIDKPSRNVGYGRALYRKVEEQCARWGYSEILTEAPCDEIGTITFLHKMGMRITDTQPSPYRSDEWLYHMARALPPIYTGDCYDLSAFADWLVNQYYPFSPSVASDQDGKKSLLLGTRHSFPLVERPNRAAVRASVVILNAESNLSQPRDAFEKAQNKGAHHFEFVLSQKFTQADRQAFERSNSIMLDEQDIYESFGAYFRYRKPPFPRSSIAGMVLAVNPKYFDRISSNPAEFSYFKGGPSGKYLTPGNTAILFSEPTPQAPDGGVKGLCDIAAVHFGSPQEVWALLEGSNPLFDKQDYLRWTRTKRDVLGLLLRNYIRIPTVSLENLLADVIREDVQLVDLGHYYVNAQMVERLNQTIGDTPTVETKDMMPLFVEATRFLLGEAKDWLTDIRSKTKSTDNTNKSTDVSTTLELLETRAPSHLTPELLADDTYLNGLINAPVGDSLQLRTSSLLKQIRTHHKNLSDLEEQQAMHGAVCPPIINRSIELERASIVDKVKDLYEIMRQVYATDGSE